MGKVTNGVATRQAPRPRVIDLDGLQALIDALRARGFTVLGPTVAHGAIVHAPITGVDELPRGWGDEQDGATTGCASATTTRCSASPPAPSRKPVLFPAEQLLWRGHGAPATASTDRAGRDAGAARRAAVRAARRALLRPARDRHPRQGAAGPARTATRTTRRARAALHRRGRLLRPGRHLLLRLDGHRAAPTGRGALRPVADRAARRGDGHRFLVEVGSERGARGARGAAAPAPAADADRPRPTRSSEERPGRMGRRSTPTGSRTCSTPASSTRSWDDVAARCLACGNCTMVCPTCFCTSVEDHTDLTGEDARAAAGLGLLLHRRLLLPARRQRPRLAPGRATGSG